MPVYLCRSGLGHDEPWRYGIQVYSTPFSLDNEDIGSGGCAETVSGGGRDLIVAAVPFGTVHTTSEDKNAPNERHLSRSSVIAGTRPAKVVGTPIRRVRHSEIVLVDDVCIAFGRYWLRLRWPGHKGGFAGYIAMAKVSDVNDYIRVGSQCFIDERTIPDEQEDEAQDEREIASMPPSEPCDSEVSMTCLRTGLVFQTSKALKLLSTYDDGVSPSVALTPFSLEPVFCRICREGLHDDADEMQPEAAEDDRDYPTSRNFSAAHNEFTLDSDSQNAVGGEPRLSPEDKKGPVQPHPAYAANAEALRNPLLAPCECSGSMAFVHYLCVEQWRCRSRHPDAHHGLNCETCGKSYALPPPVERPAPVDEENWQDAMPPHVMQALRQPHFCWQIGAAIVRRRWLRPFAPIIMSPIVALYCRARRLLKKRGVARRRWACSLCRRRARWKCVRCLRSYYCSRQCQNVSWHIVHKHVCYKPSRFAQSVVVYGALSLFACPGMLRDPFMYDLGLCLVPASFVSMSVIGGGLGLLSKKAAGVDIRGRFLEVVVVLSTLVLSVASWGLVQGFFGSPDKCYGVMGDLRVTEVNVPQLIRFVSSSVLQPAQRIYAWLDSLPLHSKLLTRALCSREIDGCFAHLPGLDFFLEENDGQACAGDLFFVTGLHIFAYFVFLGTTAWKHHDRLRRQGGHRNVHQGAARPHQD